MSSINFIYKLNFSGTTTIPLRLCVQERYDYVQRTLASRYMFASFVSVRSRSNDSYLFARKLRQIKGAQ
jgi:hypothetical protein